jgi:YbbR domain-containing protein
MRLLDNIWLKIFALFMGILVWLHVATEKTYNYELWVPVTEIALQDSLTLSQPPPDSVLVEVSATGKQLLRKQWRQRGIRINAAQFRPGVHALDLTPSNISLVGPVGDITLGDVVFPRQLDLHVDRKAVVHLPVHPNVDVSADDGFAVSRIRVVSPDQVELIGPESSLRDFDSLTTEERRLSSLSTSVTLELPIIRPPGFGYDVHPDSVTVEIEVVPVKTRVYDNLPVVVYNTPPGYVAQTDPGTIRAELTGPPEDIDLLNRTALTVSADFRAVDSNFLAPLKVDCPVDFKVKKTSVDSVQIILKPYVDTRN